jgi:hypothetical protein
VIFIPPHRGWTNQWMWRPITGRINQYTIEDTRFFSWDSRANRHASPRYVDLHLVVRWLIGNPKTSSPRASQEPTTSEVAQWHEQFTRVTFGAPLRKAQHPSQITGRWWRTITTLATTPPLPPSRLGGGNHQEKPESHSSNDPQVLLDSNSQANALGITQPHFGLESMQGRWVGESVLSSQGC